MEYKNFKITAEVQSYDFFTIGEDGQPVDYVEGGNGGEVTGYNYDNAVTGESFFETMSQSGMDVHRALIDAHVAGVIS